MRPCYHIKVTLPRDCDREAAKGMARLTLDIALRELNPRVACAEVWDSTADSHRWAVVFSVDHQIDRDVMAQWEIEYEGT